MSKVASLLQKGKRAFRDLEWLKVLQSEIKHELSNDPYKVLLFLFLVFAYMHCKDVWKYVLCLFSLHNVGSLDD